MTEEQYKIIMAAWRDGALFRQTVPHIEDEIITCSTDFDDALNRESTYNTPIETFIKDYLKWLFRKQK